MNDQEKTPDSTDPVAVMTKLMTILIEKGARRKLSMEHFSLLVSDPKGGKLLDELVGAMAWLYSSEYDPVPSKENMDEVIDTLIKNGTYQWTGDSYSGRPFSDDVRIEEFPFKEGGTTEQLAEKVANKGFRFATLAEYLLCCDRLYGISVLGTVLKNNKGVDCGVTIYSDNSISGFSMRLTPMDREWPNNVRPNPDPCPFPVVKVNY
ncbi:hypothetical protein KAR91_18790 [Candidatus Pacearchaeota archaeon]|nr:hypothetical protein [Candidatus Pacearchaeota archaeon]